MATTLTLDSFKPYVLNTLAKHREALLYLKSRRVSVAQVREFNIGFASDLLYLEKVKDFKLFPGRLVFPFVDEYNELVGSGLRVITEVDKHKRFSKFFFKDKPGYLYGIDTALPYMYAKKCVLVTEGVFDVFAVRPYFPPSVGMLTSGLTQAQCKLLKRYVDHVFYAPDNDKAGDKARENSLKYARNHFDITLVDIYAKDMSAWNEKDPDTFKQTFENLYSFLI